MTEQELIEIVRRFRPGRETLPEKNTILRLIEEIDRLNLQIEKWKKSSEIFRLCEGFHAGNPCGNCVSCIEVKARRAELQIYEARKIIQRLHQNAAPDSPAWIAAVAFAYPVAEKPLCETVLPLLNGNKTVCGNVLPCHMHTPQKRVDESPKRDFVCAKCQKPMQFKDGMCMACFGGDPGE